MTSTGDELEMTVDDASAIMPTKKEVTDAKKSAARSVALTRHLIVLVIHLIMDQCHAIVLKSDTRFVAA